MSLVPDILGNLFRRKATVMYPEERRETPQGFRGRLSFDRDKCTGCRLCWRVCPASAIEIIKDEKGFRPVFHIYRCIYCYFCVEVCPTKAIRPTDAYENIVFRREDLTLR